MKCFSTRALTVLALTARVGLLAAVPAVAAAKTNVRCVGFADFCGAKVSIAGGASNRIVTIGLPITNLKLVGVSAIPGKPRGAFGISKAAFRLGALPYRFTLSAVRSNPRGARIILLFAAGSAVTPSPRPGGSLGLPLWPQDEGKRLVRIRAQLELLQGLYQGSRRNRHWIWKLVPWRCLAVRGV